MVTSCFWAVVPLGKIIELEGLGTFWSKALYERWLAERRQSLPQPSVDSH
jgi:hypothetical protein